MFPPRWKLSAISSGFFKMNKLLLFLLLLLPSAAFGADLPITGYTADTSPGCRDLLFTTKDPAGTPLDRKVAWGDMFCRVTSTSDPTVNDDSGDGFVAGRVIWFNSTSPGSYFLLHDATVGAAVWQPIGGVITEAQTLNDVVALDATTTGRNSCANAFKVEGSTAGNGIALLDDGANGPELVPYIAGVCNDANRGARLNSMKLFEIKDSAGAVIFRQAEATGAVTFPTAAKAPTRSIYLPARYAEVDGTLCLLSRQQQNGGPFKGVMRCSSTGRFDLTFNTKGFKYSGGTVVLTAHSFHGTSESVTWTGAISMQCRSPGDVINSTYSTPVNLSIAITSADLNELKDTDLAAHTPNGTCAADDEIDVLGSVTAAGNAANTQIIGWTLTFPITGL